MIKIFYDNLLYDNIVQKFEKALKNFKHEIIYVLNSTNEKKHWNTDIYLCFGMVNWYDNREFPKYMILIQLEDLNLNGISERYLYILKQSWIILDYSKFHQNYYIEYNFNMKNIFYMDLVVSIDETKYTINDQDKYIDILFIGENTEYRLNMEKTLNTIFTDKYIVFIDNIWGKERDDMISKSKILLYLHRECNENINININKYLYYSLNTNNYILCERFNSYYKYENILRNCIFFDNIKHCINIIKSIFDNENIYHIKNSNININIDKLLEYLKTLEIVVNFNDIRQDINICNIINKNIKWFDKEYQQCNKQLINYNDTSIPYMENECLDNIINETIDIELFSKYQLPTLSYCTLLTVESIERYSKLLIWMYENRNYPINRYEWIIICNKAKNENEKLIIERFRNTSLKNITNFRWIEYTSTNDIKKSQINRYYDTNMKKQIAISNCRNEYIYIQNFDDKLYLEDSNNIKRKMVLLLSCKNNYGICSKEVLVYNKNYKYITIKKSILPDENTFLFHRDLLNKERITPSMNGDFYLYFVEHADKIIYLSYYKYDIIYNYSIKEIYCDEGKCNYVLTKLQINDIICSESFYKII